MGSLSDYPSVCPMLHAVSLSVLTAVFLGGPGLAGTSMSLLWILLELRVIEVVCGDNWSYKTCKVPVIVCDGFHIYS